MGAPTLWRMSLAVWLVLAGSSAGAGNVAIPAPVGHVNDVASVLSAAERQELEDLLTTYEKETGHQFMVLTLKTLGGEPLEPFALRVAEQWKPGDRQRDDGLLVLAVIDDRRMRIEVGYGLEGAITDAASSRVISDVMAPRFREQQYGAGLRNGLQALMRLGRGESLGAPAAPTLEEDPSVFLAPLMVLLVLASLLRPLPRMGRMPLLGMVGGALGGILLGSLWAALALMLAGVVLGIFRIPWWWMFTGGRGGKGGRLGGGFSGGGGHFGGGGSSGKW